MSHPRIALLLIVVCAAGRARAGEVDVVIDPGHGGSNTGSPGRGQMLEKHVTMILAKAVRGELINAGLRVAMTRTTDDYVPIRARARIANALSPECFVSLHTNASPEHTRQGVETYLLARDAVDIHARAAARHASDDAEAMIVEQRVLADARTSLDLARRIQQSLLAPGTNLDAPSYVPMDRGVRQAAYDVLGDADVPAVLVEAGFLDHPIEGRYLASAAGQREVAHRIATAIIAFVNTRRAPHLARSSTPSAPVALTRR